MKKVNDNNSNFFCPVLVIDITFVVNRKVHPLSPTAAATGAENSNSFL